MEFFKWHKNILKKAQNFTGLTDYQVLWIAFLKGIIIGALVIYFYMTSA